MGRNKKMKKDKKQNQPSTTDQDITESNNIYDTQDEECSETSDNKMLKRLHQHDSENSDTEDEPRKPKKKKKATALEQSSTGKKNKTSKRQMKKEKYAARLALEQAHAKDQTQLQCLNYLSQWKHDKQNWKFMKVKQVWLQKNKFSIELIPEASWPLLIEYFESAKGNIKTILLEDANKIIKQMDEWTESQTNQDAKSDKEESETTEVVKPDDAVYRRARSIIQCLQE